MMSSTHAAAGLLLVWPLLRAFPEFATVGALAALAGGVFPDLDLAVGEHRKTLHYPIVYWLPAVSAAGIAIVSPSMWAVAAAALFGSAALHSATDWLGAGDELRPWERTSEKAVYLHPRRRWLSPKYWVRYDGAPEDLFVAVAFAAPSVYVLDGVAQTAVVAAVAVSALYVLVRKPMVLVTQKVVDALPPRFVDRLPARFVEDFR